MSLFRPSLIWRYVFKEVLGPTTLGLLIYVLVFLMNALFELAELAIKKDLPLATVAKILLFYLPRVLVMTFPMAILLGTLVGVGRLSSDSEVVALGASGVSYRKILAPILLLGLLGWGGATYLIVKVEPEATYERHRVYNELMYAADPRREIKPRVFFEQIPGLLLYADEVHESGDFLDKVFIHQRQEGGEEIVTLARRAQIDYNREDGRAEFFLEGGTTHSTAPEDPEDYQISSFERQRFVKEPDESFKLKSSLLNRPPPKNFREQSLAELTQSIARAASITHEETRNRVIGTIRAFMHERFALPFACLAFAILGVPLGIMNRRGGKTSGFSLSVAIAITYWILLSLGENFVRQGTLSPYIGLWLGNALLAGLGLMLFIVRERREGLSFSLRLPARLKSAFSALRRKRSGEDSSGESLLPRPLGNLGVVGPAVGCVFE